MNENEIGGIVVDGAVKVHMRLGPGLLESMMQYCLDFGEILMKDGISRIIKWQTGMISLFFSVSPCLRVTQFFRVELWVKVWVCLRNARAAARLLFAGKPAPTPWFRLCRVRSYA